MFCPESLPDRTQWPESWQTQDGAPQREPLLPNKGTFRGFDAVSKAAFKPRVTLLRASGASINTKSRSVPVCPEGETDSQAPTDSVEVDSRSAKHGDQQESRRSLHRDSEDSQSKCTNGGQTACCTKSTSCMPETCLSTWATAPYDRS